VQTAPPEISRDKLDVGMLPRDWPIKLWAGNGSGKPCTACEHPSPPSEPKYIRTGVQTSVRRSVIRRWAAYALLEHTIAGGSQGGGQCMICERRIDSGETDFVITFRGAVAVRLDRDCMDLWRQEVWVGEPVVVRTPFV
jgi:hypothetical protein